MTGYIVHRLLQSLAVVALMSFVIYGLIGLMPGDPIDLMVSGNPNLTSDDAARLKRLHGLDRPLVERYGVWATATLSGDLGYSRAFGQPVLSVIAPRLANTIVLMALGFGLALAIALPVGVLAARRPGSLADRAVNLACFAGISLPTFWLALILILIFAVSLKLLPASGMATIGASLGFWAGLADRATHLVLPVATLAIVNIAGYTRYLRAAMIETLGEDYIRTARAKGLPETRVLWRHALRNAALPVVTVSALEFGALFSGALITETMFAYPGMGKLIYDAVLGNDFNLALAGLLLATLVTLMANLAADIAYAWLDPRIAYG
ncbi:MAG: ABC transporter permease [Alphaproteobacteria bacterium]|nr:ABC transporter permease [Alphaproteobacteria bacterium]